MNGKWIAIFKSGKQTDSAGNEHDGDAVIDTAIAKFNAEEHEPPVVIGHPKTNAPAFGWVEGLKRDGDLLLAKIKDAAPEFVEMVERGLFKKRSAAFYPDGSLRHVGFLGAASPAVKGLPDIQFKDEENVVIFEFSQQDDSKFAAISRILGRFRDWVIEKEDAETADKIIDSFDLEFIKKPSEKEVGDDPLFSQPTESEEGMPDATFTQKQLDEAKEQAAKEARDTAKKEFEEENKEEKDRLAKLEANFEEKKKKDHKAYISSFVEQGVKAGKILPAWEKSGLSEFMESLDNEAEIEFADGEGKTKKATQFEQFKGLMDVFPQSVNFNEISAGDGPEAGASLDKLAKEFAEKNNVEYKEALLEVSKLNPQLVEQ